MRVGLKVTPRSFAEFWPHYVRAHREPLTRGIHVAGTFLGWSLLLASLLLRRPWLAPAGLVVAYPVAWCSHLFIERNRPATFGHPLWSFLADHKMLALALTGRMAEEARRCTGDA